MKLQDEIINIIKIDQSRLSSINQFLSVITKLSNSAATILWELNSKLDYLFVVADSFSDNSYITPVHSLPLNESITGNAINVSKSIYIPDISKSKLFYEKISFINDLDIKSLFVIPVKFENGAYGALNIYNTNIDGISIDLQRDLTMVASILPSWYHSLQDRATYSLIKKVEKKLKAVESSYLEQPISKEMMCKHLQILCEYVAETFQSYEVSIILNDPFKNANVYECLASTWITGESQMTYQANMNNGLTGWILCKNESVHIADLNQFEDDTQKRSIQKQYPGIKWNAKGDFKAALALKLQLDLNKPDLFPPIGFIGTPIYIGAKILGVVRCSAAIKSPYYLGTRELEILKLIATRIGEVWNNWIQHSLIKEDSNTWMKIITTTNDLDGFVLTELIKPTPNIDTIFKKVLAALPDLVKDATILDVRLLDHQTNELYFASTYGIAWEEGTETEKEKRYKKRFEVDGDRVLSVGSQVVRYQKLQILDPIDKMNDCYDETFEQATRMISAPLIIRNSVLGVLDVRSTTDRPFQSTALHAVELMAGQLAIYHELVNSVLELKGLQIYQIKTFQDFAHQIRSPIYQASIRSKLAVKEASVNSALSNTPLLKHINAASGLCNKAYRVATNLRLFSDLSKPVPLNIEKTQIKSITIIKLLIESASDNMVIINPSKNLTINVEKESFYLLDQMNVSFDLNMLEQSINILLDNAIKYSHNNSTIQIFGKKSENNNFQLVIKNKGIPINEREATLCRIRGWRSEFAKMVTGEGGGIGLWVLDKIMSAHGGNLDITPTDINGITEIKIIFMNKLS